MTRYGLSIAFPWAFLAALLLAAQAAAREPGIVPMPASMSRQPGELRIGDGTPIVVPAGDESARRVALNFAELARRTYGLRLPVSDERIARGAIRLRLEGGALLGPEAYRLVSARDGVTITAATPAGLAHGTTTLWQLIKAGTVPFVIIEDAPRFAWRGLMLDSARHYQSPEFIRRFIDWMAIHKLNVLHWHLTDDQAWRLEIRKYPRLTEVGAWRVPAGPAAGADIDPASGKPRQYGGFYSQDTVRDLVAYASERGITIVPEIEMPGHAAAALAAYPALAATASPPARVPSDWGIYPHVYSLEDSTFALLEDVLREVMALFPGQYIHVGGDEVDKTQWRESPRAQARMRELAIDDPARLQAYFTQRIARFLQANGRRLVGWDEILEPGLPPGAVVMSWRGVDGALAAAANGYDTVLAAHPTLYFDNRQGTASDEPPGRARVVSLKDVYDFEPMPAALTPGQRVHVLGLQGNLWTEHIRTEERVAAMAFPRAAAIAELGWSAPERRRWPDFIQRVATLAARYSALGLPAADSAFAVQARSRYPAGMSSAHVELFTQAGVGDIRYTLDGKEPSAASPRYSAPLSVKAPGELRAASFDGRARLSRTRTFELRREKAQLRASQELELCSDNIALSLEDDAPLRGPRAVFLVDIQNPCWLFKGAQLDAVTGLSASVGQVPFNFQIGDDVKKIRFAKPATPEGELEVRLGSCDGELLARLPLAPAAQSQGVTRLPRAKIQPRAGRYDLCLRFAQNGVDPMWVIDSIQLLEGRR